MPRVTLHDLSNSKVDKWKQSTHDHSADIIFIFFSQKYHKRKRHPDTEQRKRISTRYSLTFHLKETSLSQKKKLKNSIDSPKSQKHQQNHYPLLLEASFSIHAHTSNFKFLNMWTLHDNCKDFIAHCWSTSVVGCPIYVLTKTSQLLKNNLKSWNRDIFGNKHVIVKNSSDNLDKINDQIFLDGNNLLGTN